MRAKDLTSMMTQLEKLLSIMCTDEEILGILGVCKKTLDAKCVEYYGESYEDIKAMYSGMSKANLRKIQFNQAKTNPIMAIFLGKQYLGQSDKVDNKVVEQVSFVSDLPEDDEE